MKTERKAFFAKNILLKVAEGILKAIEEGKKFLEFPNLKMLSIDEKTIKEAQEIVERYKLKPRDAIHAGCAIRNNIKEIITDNPDFDKIREIKRFGLERFSGHKISK